MFNFLDLKDKFKIVAHTIKLNTFQQLVKFEVSQCLGQDFHTLQSNVTEIQKRVHRERSKMSQFKAGNPAHIEIEVNFEKREIHFFHLKYPREFRIAEVETKKVRLFSVVPV
jgi:hypothetical protein